MQYRAWRLVTFLAARSPAWVASAVAVLAGTAAFYAWPRGHRATMRNFRRVLPGASPAEVRRTARRSLVNYCRYLADFVRFPSLSAEGLVQSVRGADAFGRLDEALARGKGAIIVCMHFGSWDLGAGAAAARGYPLTVVVETFGDRRLDAMVVGARRRLGMDVVKMERAAPSLVRALRRNGLLALLIDRPTPGDGVPVTFFGREVQVPAGAARLALRTGAAVVPTAFARDGHHVVALADFTVDVAPSGDEAADVLRLTQQIMTAHERFIRAYPDQWYMFREMWPRQRAEAVAR